MFPKQRIAIPLWASKLNRIATWLWVLTLVFGVIAGFSRYKNWDVLEAFFAGGMWVFGIAFAASVLASMIAALAAIFGIFKNQRDI